jgi:4-hydroxy-3-methylbut-2-enyl diphosphate reductase IspH
VTVGVVSGASTPDWIIQRVLARLDEIRAQLGG